MIGPVQDAVGKVGCRILFVLAIPIHLATIFVAYQWYGGIPGTVAAVVSAVIPGIPEVYWAVRMGMREGLWHWYVLLVAAYPVAWMAFLAGGMIVGRGREDDVPADPPEPR